MDLHGDSVHIGTEWDLRGTSPLHGHPRPFPPNPSGLLYPLLQTPITGTCPGMDHVGLSEVEEFSVVLSSSVDVCTVKLEVLSEKMLKRVMDVETRPIASLFPLFPHLFFHSRARPSIGKRHLRDGEQKFFPSTQSDRNRFFTAFEQFSFFYRFFFVSICR